MRDQGKSALRVQTLEAVDKAFLEELPLSGGQRLWAGCVSEPLETIN